MARNSRRAQEASGKRQAASGGKKRDRERKTKPQMEGRDVGGGNPPQSDPLTGGEFLLQLLRRPPQSHQQMTTTSAQIDAPLRFLYKDPAVGQVNPHFLPSTFNFSDVSRPQFHPPPPWTLPHGAPPPPHRDTAGISLPQFSPPPPGFAPHSQFVPVDRQRGIFQRGSSEGNQQLGFRNEELDVGGRGRNLGDLEQQRNPIEYGQLGARGSQGRSDGGSHVPDHTMSSVGFGQFTYNETDRSHLNDRGKMLRPSLRDQGNKQLGFGNEELDVGGRGGNLSSGRQQRYSIDYGQLGAGVSQGRDVVDGSVSNHTMSSGGVGFGHFAHKEADGSHLNDGGKMVLPSLKGQSQHNAQRMSKRRSHELQNRPKQSSGPDGWSNSPTRRQNANHGDGMVNELKYVLPQFGCIVQPVNLQRQLNLDHKVNHAGDIPGNDQNLCSQSQDGKHKVKKEDREGIAREKQHANENCREKEKLGSDALVRQLEDSLEIVEEQDEKSELKVNGSKIKDFRSDFSRGHYVSSQRVRIRRGSIECRYDIRRLSSSFLSIYNSLVPSEEEIGKQKELLMSLKLLVKKEWPNADLHLYGSCANSFGVSNSDIDICLAINDSETTKADILSRLADILLLNNFQNVQALTRARVPIVKLMDPVFSISCDICVNNLLAVVNTKLLRDYARIDERLRQLAFLVKHWAKSREVNEAYQGTLSSYAYVLMCIHFLQQCRPPILPCLQEMRATYVVTVEGKNCAFFDELEELRNFGSSNKQGVAELLWGFFNYWAFQHDYTNNVISVRTGSIIRKHVKNWTKRIGNERHLICIEDPFEISHDLGRVVDKYSIRILREEFERAANILQDFRDPCTGLFEPYVRGFRDRLKINCFNI